MISSIQRLVRATDCVVARAYLSLFRERSALLSFLFHSLFRDEREIALNQVDPLQRTTVAQFRRFVEYYLAHDYRFIGPADLLGGLDPDGKYAMITFDDGYFNNTLALPILEEYRVPAVVFVSTDHVRQNKCFLVGRALSRACGPGRHATEGVRRGHRHEVEDDRADRAGAEGPLRR